MRRLFKQPMFYSPLVFLYVLFLFVSHFATSPSIRVYRSNLSVQGRHTVFLRYFDRKIQSLEGYAFYSLLLDDLRDPRDKFEKYVRRTKDGSGLDSFDLIELRGFMRIQLSWLSKRFRSFENALFVFGVLFLFMFVLGWKEFHKVNILLFLAGFGYWLPLYSCSLHFLLLPLLLPGIVSFVCWLLQWKANRGQKKETLQQHPAEVPQV